MHSIKVLIGHINSQTSKRARLTFYWKKMKPTSSVDHLKAKKNKCTARLCVPERFIFVLMGPKTKQIPSISAALCSSCSGWNDFGLVVEKSLFHTQSCCRLLSGGAAVLKQLQVLSSQSFMSAVCCCGDGGLNKTKKKTSASTLSGV